MKKNRGELTLGANAGGAEWEESLLRNAQGGGVSWVRLRGAEGVAQKGTEDCPSWLEARWLGTLWFRDGSGRVSIYEELSEP